MGALKESKEKYEELLEKISSRKGVLELSEYLKKHGLFEAPASTKFHLCSEGGLIIHSVSVATLALKMKSVMYPEADDDSVILCSLFHDAHKVTDGFSHKTYIQNNTETAARQPYFWNKEQMNFSGGQKSLLIVSKFVDLTKDEMQAIAYHDGPYVPSWDDIKWDPYPMTLLIHSADMWSTWVLEKNKNKTIKNNKFMEDME